MVRQNIGVVAHIARQSDSSTTALPCLQHRGRDARASSHERVPQLHMYNGPVSCRRVPDAQNARSMAAAASSNAATRPRARHCSDLRIAAVLREFTWSVTLGHNCNLTIGEELKREPLPARLPPTSNTNSDRRCCALSGARSRARRATSHPRSGCDLQGGGRCGTRAAAARRGESR